MSLLRFGDDEFHLESYVDPYLPKISQRAIGYFTISIGGKTYGVKANDATLLACSYDAVLQRLKDNRIDSVDREHSNMVLRKGLQWIAPRDMVSRGEPIPDNVDPSRPSKYVFNLKAIGDRHIWRDKHIGGATCFISDAIGDLFKREGLTGLRLDESKAEQV